MKLGNGRKILLLFILVYFFSSCSKTVYSYRDDRGESRYIIYSDNYKYVEKSKYGSFHNWGKYKIKGDTICFDVIDLKNIPYTYCSDEFTKLGKYRNPDYIYMKVMDKNNNPMIYAQVVLKDCLHKTVKNGQTDLDGIVSIKNHSELCYIEIDYAGFSKYRLDYRKSKGYDILIEMEQLESGGLTEGTCFMYETGATLKYKMNNQLQQKSLERNSIVYRNCPQKQ
jgi:hypothetical protein